MLLVCTGCSGTSPSEATPEMVSERAQSPEVGRLRETGGVWVSEGDLAAAAARFDQALALEPENAGLWVDIARLRYRSGEQEQSIEAVEQALDFAPDDASALLFRGQIARDAEGLLAGLRWIERGLQFHPDDPALLHAHAAILIDLDRAAEGLVSLRRLAEIVPDTPDLFYLQAVIAARAGNFGLARDLLRRLPPGVSDQPVAMLLGAVISLEEGEHASAAQSLEALARRQPDNARVQRLLARALYLAGSYRQVIMRFGDMAAREGAAPYLRELVAMSHEAMGDRTGAAVYLDLAASDRGWNLVALEPAAPPNMDGGGSNIVTVRNRIRASIGSGATDAATATARALLDSRPGAGDAFSLYGDSMLAAGDARGALAVYSRAARIRTNWPLASRMAAAADALGDTQRAEEIIGAYLRNGGNEIEAVELYGAMLARRGGWSRMAQLLDTVIDRSSENPRILALRSHAAFELRQFDEALGWAWRAYRAQSAYRPAIVVLARSTQDAALKARLEEKLTAIDNR